MANSFDCASSIGPILTQGKFKIKVRVVRLWSLRPYGNDFKLETNGIMEMVLYDREVMPKFYLIHCVQLINVSCNLFSSFDSLLQNATIGATLKSLFMKKNPKTQSKKDLYTSCQGSTDVPFPWWVSVADMFVKHVSRHVMAVQQLPTSLTWLGHDVKWLEHDYNPVFTQVHLKFLFFNLEEPFSY